MDLNFHMFRLLSESSMRRLVGVHCQATGNGTEGRNLTEGLEEGSMVVFLKKNVSFAGVGTPSSACKKK
jgi:hypothetical protein